jgi:hypothetical protein
MNLSIFSKMTVAAFAAFAFVVPASVPAKPVSPSSTVRHAAVSTDTATKNGRADGLKAGRSDQQHHKPHNYAAHANYQNGLRGYKPGMGSSADFKRTYQKAFENGYDAGYNGY